MNLANTFQCWCPMNCSHLRADSCSHFTFEFTDTFLLAKTSSNFFPSLFDTAIQIMVCMLALSGNSLVSFSLSLSLSLSHSLSLFSFCKKSIICQTESGYTNAFLHLVSFNRKKDVVRNHTLHQRFPTTAPGTTSAPQRLKFKVKNPIILQVRLFLCIFISRCSPKWKRLGSIA